MAEIHLVSAATGNPLYEVSSPDGMCIYVSARERGLEKRLRRAVDEVDKSYIKRIDAITKAKS